MSRFAVDIIVSESSGSTCLLRSEGAQYVWDDGNAGPEYV